MSVSSPPDPTTKTKVTYIIRPTADEYAQVRFKQNMYMIHLLVEAVGDRQTGREYYDYLTSEAASLERKFGFGSHK